MAACECEAARVYGSNDCTRSTRAPSVHTLINSALTPQCKYTVQWERVTESSRAMDESSINSCLELPTFEPPAIQSTASYNTIDSIHISLRFEMGHALNGESGW